MIEPHVRVRRYPYEEPAAIRLEVIASNGLFAGTTEFFCNTSDLLEIGHRLRSFPTNVGDEYFYEAGAWFGLRAYTFDNVGHTAMHITMGSLHHPPDEGSCRFSIRADARAINRLGKLLCNFADLQHLELHWTLHEASIYEEYQPPYP